MEHYKDPLLDERLREEKKEYIQRWEASGLLEGLVGEGIGKMAHLLENQSKEINHGKEKETTPKIFLQLLLPLVRRVFGPYVDHENFETMSLPADMRHGFPLIARTVWTGVGVTDSVIKELEEYSKIEYESEWIEYITGDLQSFVKKLVDEPKHKIVAWYVPFRIWKSTDGKIYSIVSRYAVYSGE